MRGECNHLSPVPSDPEVLVVSGSLTLLGVDREHAQHLLRALRDPDIAVMSPLPLVQDADDADAGALAWCEARADWSDGSHASWAISAGDRFAGSISLFHLDFDQRTGETGYWLLPEFRGQGIATAALRAAADYAFGKLGLHRVELFHAVENVASCRVAEGAGFRLEGTHRQSYRYGDGEYHDEHSHARLAADQPAPALRDRRQP